MSIASRFTAVVLAGMLGAGCATTRTEQIEGLNGEALRISHTSPDGHKIEVRAPGSTTCYVTFRGAASQNGLNSTYGQEEPPGSSITCVSGEAVGTVQEVFKAMMREIKDTFIPEPIQGVGASVPPPVVDEYFVSPIPR